MSETPTPTPKRLSLSQIVEMILSRRAGERSSVSLSRNAAGATQIEVTVGVSEHGDITTIDAAERKARDIFNGLRDDYPGPVGHDNAEISYTRNAKGETQVAVTAKTGEHGERTLSGLAKSAEAVYDTARMRYPMADGRSAKPGTVSLATSASKLKASDGEA